MQDLNFRRKRRKPGRRKRGKGKELKFEVRGPKLQFDRQGFRTAAATGRVVLPWIIEIVIVCLFAVFLVASFGQRVSNAGDSMNPVLENGDVVLINRLVYNIKGPSRGDVVAFRPGGDESTHYSIKRIVGLPGETVQIVDGSVYIDGEEMTSHIFVSDIEFAGLASEPVELGEDEYFVIGDHDTASDDSRMTEIGNVSRDDIFGKIWFVTNFGENFGFVKD